MTYENYDITVRGCTLTIDGTHTFYKLTLDTNGILTHSQATSGQHITVTTDATISNGSKIDLDSRGYGEGSGPGGGEITPSGFGNGASHGGTGGRGADGQLATKLPYASIIDPTELGSGGGRTTIRSNDFGSPGGGGTHLTVFGILTVNGMISANGGVAFQAGAGSGGSLWIEAGTLAGNGSIQANGGNITNGYAGGGGGGGRIAIHAKNRTLPLANIKAQGGAGWYGSLLSEGCPGTIYTGIIRSISGVVTLEDASNKRQLVTFELRSGDHCASQTTIELGANGEFFLPEVLPGQYTLAIKGSKWLRVTQPVDTRNGDVTGILAFLKAGDANDDNTIDVLDLDALIQFFDKCEGDEGFNNNADFNCDGCVDVLDLDLLIRNFDAEGEA